jgi:DNA-binding response OmpR family regulator
MALVSATDAPARPRILVVDADPALFGLLEAWLGAEAQLVAGTRDCAPPESVDLVVVDVPYARQAAAEGLRDLAARHDGAPLLALSPTLFAGVASDGGVARRLGVAAVLPTPVARESFVAAVRRLLERPS